MDKLYSLIAGFIIRFNKLIIAVTILLVAGLSVLIFFLDFENDITSWVDKNSSLGKMPHYINERFGNNSPLIIAIQFDELFTFDNLNRLKAFSDELEKMETVDDVTSIATIDDITSTVEGIRVEKLIRYPLPDNARVIAVLKERMLSKKNYVNRIVSADGNIALVMVRLNFSVKSDRVALVVKDRAQSIFKDTSARLYFTGGPFLMNSMAEIVISDFIFLIPLVTLLVLLILFLSFRTIRGVILPLITVLFSTAMTLGIMSLLGVPLNIMSSAVPVILIAVGSAYGIHVLNNYYENAKKLADKKKIVGRMIREVGLPVLMAGLTTIAGFFSNITAEVSVIKTFGLFTSLGVAIALLIALFFIPAVLFNLKIKGKSRSGKKHAVRDRVQAGRFSSAVARFISRHRLVVVICLLAVALVIFIFSFRITSKVDILGYFSDDSEPRAASRFINEHFDGFNPLDIYIKGDMNDPDILKLCLMIEERIKSYEHLSHPSGIADVVCELNHAMTGVYTIPETKAQVENLMFFVQDKSMLKQLVTKEKTESLIAVLLPTLENNYLEGLFDHLDGYIDPFRQGITIENNTAGHPAIVSLERMMIANLLDEEGIAHDAARLDRCLNDCVNTFQEKRDVFDAKALFNYCIGDEAEILLEDEEAQRLVGKVGAQKEITIESLKGLILESLDFPNDFSDEEITSFARGILILIGEMENSARRDELSAVLLGSFSDLKNSHAAAINYAVSPFLWKSIPVAKPAKGAVIRTTPVETIALTGNAFLIEGIRKNIFSSQVTSLLIALLAVLILNSLTFRSFRKGIMSLAVIIITVGINFGIMGIFSIPLDFVTAIIASVAIGTGIDYTIHFITRFTRETKRQKKVLDAYQITLATTGRAILSNAASVGLGYAVLLASNVVPLRTAGILLAATMATSSLGALTLLPAVFLLTKIFSKRKAR